MSTQDWVQDILLPGTRETKKLGEKSTGLFFGSFNPIHNGHLMIANYILEYSSLDEVFFVVSPQNPFKKKHSLLSARDRLELVRLATNDSPLYQACDIELSMPTPSYTIDTLAYLQDKYPHRKFSLIMGSDNLQTLHKWKAADLIQKEYQIIVYPRPGFFLPKSPENAHIIPVEAPLIEVSSTLIRKSIQDGKSLQFYMPTRCWRYIREMHFYEK